MSVTGSVVVVVLATTLLAGLAAAVLAVDAGGWAVWLAPERLAMR